MAIKDKTKTIQRRNLFLTPEEQEKYNQWCKEMNVSRQYHTPTRYYPNEWHLEREPDNWIERVVSWIFK